MSAGEDKYSSDNTEEDETKQVFDHETLEMGHSQQQDEPILEPKSRGVRRIEMIKLSLDTSPKGKTMKWMFFISILVCSWARALDGSTTYSYQPYATSSFGRHSMLSTVEIATSIISAVSLPFIAKISDITTRPISYVVLLIFYILGYIIIASSQTISAYVVGTVFQAIGSSGIDLLNTIVIGDMTPLKHRGLMQGIMSSPYIINVWFSGLIVEALAASNWRWGYGMFAIIMPVTLAPAIGIMVYLDKHANFDTDNAENTDEEAMEGDEDGLEKMVDTTSKLLSNGYYKVIKDLLIEIDALGLIIMGFGWSLLLLPFSLYANAENQWKNPSLIAMFVVGGILLIIYAVYEIWFCPLPSMPRRVLFNKTFISAVIIDFFYEVGGYIRLLYLSSYAFVVTNWSSQNWTYYNNTLTMLLCVFGVVAGLIHAITHRYKYVQIIGISILIIGNGIIIRNKSAAIDTATLVMVQILCGAGGAFSVIGSQVSSQASVPHQDMSLVIALLSLWTSIGAAIGSAIGAPIWSSKLPKYLREYMPASVTDAQVAELFGSTTLIRENAWGSEIRNAAIKLYQSTEYYLFCIGLGIYFIPLIAACFQTNFYLGDTQNAVEPEPVLPKSRPLRENQESD